MSQKRDPGSAQAMLLQVVVHDINHDILAKAGLRSIGVASGMGRGGSNRALCIIPGMPQNVQKEFSFLSSLKV